MTDAGLVHLKENKGLTFLDLRKTKVTAKGVEEFHAAPRAPFGHSELKPLRLSDTEKQQLVAFLRTLTGPLQAPAGFLDAPMPRR